MNQNIVRRPHVPEDELHAYCDGELSPAQRMEIAEHLLGCLICRAQHAQVEAVRSRSSALLAIASPRFSETAMPDIRRKSWQRRMVRGLAAAAAAVVVLGTGVAFSLNSNAPTGGAATLASSLASTSIFRLGRGEVDAAAIRNRKLTIADRDTPTPQVLAPRVAVPFAVPVRLGAATEVDPVITSEWTVATLTDALKAADGKLARVDNIPVKMVRIHTSAQGGRPTFLIRQELPDGRFIWVLEGLERDIAPVDQVLQASGIATSMPTRTRPDYVGTGAETSITVRMVRVVGYLPADSLNALALKLVLR